MTAPTLTTAQAAAHAAVLQRLRQLCALAATLAADLDGQAQREAAQFESGYWLGYAAGRDVGQAQAERAMATEWARLAASIRLYSRATTADLERRRYPGYTPEQLRQLRAAARTRHGVPTPPPGEPHAPQRNP